METENKSQLAKDLAHALFVCNLRDDLYELADDAGIQGADIERRTRDLIHKSYRAATVLLACAINSKDIQGALGR